MKSTCMMFIVAMCLGSMAFASSLETSSRTGHIGKGESCDYQPDGCEEGLSCVGNPGNMRCFAKRTEGEKCGKDPFWVCADGLRCRGKICRKIPIGRGGSCNNPHDMCRAHLKCLGPEGDMKCFPERREGQRCGKDPYWVCAEGLSCVYNRCRKDKIPKGGACNNEHDVCEDGLSCVGNEGNKKCFAKRQEGEKCGKDPFWVCDHGLVCEYNICQYY